MEEQIGSLIFVAIGVVVVLVVRRVFGMHKRGLAQGAESLDGVAKSIAIAEENLALNKQRAAQGKETLELLKAINENLKHRNSKN